MSSRVYENKYTEIKGDTDYALINRRFETTGAYMRFCEDWIRTCCRLSKTKGNPNRRLMKRWIG